MSDERDDVTQVTTVVKPSRIPDGPGGGDCVVIIYTKEPTLLGKRFVLEIETMRVGRGSENHVVLDADSVSRRHAHFEQRGATWYVVDDQSTNGTYVNDELIPSERPLSNGDRVKIGSTIFKYLSGHDVESMYHEEIYKMTIVDGLTGAHVKRYLLEALDRELTRAKRHLRPLSLVMFDVDHFKRINDTLGHLAGDYALKELARVVQSRIRRDELLARYGGEEFALVLPETPLEGAEALAETLRQRIESHEFVFEGERIDVTVSLGVAARTESMTGPADLIQAADACLYIAKRTGRNRVVATPEFGAP